MLIGGDADNDSALENTSADDVREEVTETDQENAAIGLQYFLLRSVQNNLSTAASVRFSGAKPIGILKTRYRHSLKLQPWLTKFTQSIEWLTEDEFVIPSRFDAEIPLSDHLAFRTTLNGTWFEKEDGYFYNASTAFVERLSQKKGIRYEWANQFRTSPNNRLDETALRVRYRQVLWRDWLKFELVPQLAFPRDRDFDPTPGIYAGIEISFGG